MCIRDSTKVALEANGIDAVAAGSFILSLKYNGVELGTPLDYSTYWQLFINGKSSDYTADNVTIHAGDTVTWFYGGWGDQLPSDSVHASVQVLGKDKDGKQQVWASTGQTSLKAGSTAKDLLEQTGLTLDAGESSWGWFLNGITSASYTHLDVYKRQLLDSVFGQVRIPGARNSAICCH